MARVLRIGALLVAMGSVFGAAFMTGGAVMLTPADADADGYTSNLVIEIGDACGIAQSSPVPPFAVDIYGIPQSTRTLGDPNAQAAVTEIGIIGLGGGSAGDQLQTSNGGLAFIDSVDKHVGCLYFTESGQAMCTGGGNQLITVKLLSASTTSGSTFPLQIYRWADNACKGPLEPQGPTPTDCTIGSQHTLISPGGTFCTKTTGTGNVIDFFYAAYFRFPLNEDYGEVTIVFEETIQKL